MQYKAGVFVPQIHILHVLKSFYKNNDPLFKNCLKRYVFNLFLKPVKDGDLRKSNGGEFHSLGAHTEKALSRKFSWMIEVVLTAG